MKRILLVAYACAPNQGSEENVGWNWANGLAKEGYEVHCVTNVMYKSQIQEALRRSVMKNIVFTYVPLSFGLDYFLLNPKWKTIYLHYYIWKRIAATTILKLHREQPFELAHHVTYGSFQQGSCLYGLKNCKVIFGPVGGGQRTFSFFREYFGKEWFWENFRNKASSLMLKYSKGLRKTLLQSSFILAANPETMTLVSNHYPEFSKKVHLYTDVALPKRYEKNSAPNFVRHGPLKILWVGRLIPRKGLKLSLEALSRVDSSLSYELTIVGDGEQKSHIDKWIAEYGLNLKNINRVGTVPFDDLHKYYNASDVLLFCSLRDTTGSQILEAMSFGLPVITLGINGAGYILPDDCGIKIKPLSKKQVIDAVTKAIEQISDFEFRQNMGKRAYLHAMTCTWKRKIAETVQTFYLD